MADFERRLGERPALSAVATVDRLSALGAQGHEIDPGTRDRQAGIADAVAEADAGNDLHVG